MRRAAAGRLVSLLVHLSPDEDPLLAIMQQMAAEAASLGLTPEMIDAELAAHKAERRR